MDYHTFQTTFCETFPSISTWKRTFRSSWTWAPEQKDHPSPTKLERQFHVAPAMQQPNTAVSTPLLWIFKTKNKAKRALKCKATVTHSDLHTTRAQWVCSEAEIWEYHCIVANVKHFGIIPRWGAWQVFINLKYMTSSPDCLKTSGFTKPWRG